MIKLILPERLFSKQSSHICAVHFVRLKNVCYWPIHLYDMYADIFMAKPFEPLPFNRVRKRQMPDIMQ